METPPTALQQGFQEKVKSKKYLFFILLIVLVLALLAGWLFWSWQKQQAYKKVLADNEALLIIADEQGKERWFKGPVIDGMTIRDALITSARAGGFDADANWKCRLDSQEIIQEDLSQKTIQPKDKISCSY